MLRGWTYRGRHRKPTRTARKAVVLAAGGALSVAALPGTADAVTDEGWDRLAECESSGNWAINTGNGYSGGLQFHPRTWTGFGGREFAPAAYQASRQEQMVVAERVLKAQGWGAWPVCSRKAGVRGQQPTQRPAPGSRQTPQTPQTPQRVSKTSKPSTPPPVVPTPPAPKPELKVAPKLPKLSPGPDYLVQPGDTLDSIARRLGTTWRQLAGLNQLADPHRIRPGDRIRTKPASRPSLSWAPVAFGWHAGAVSLAAELGAG